jgi:hypothetical protein
LFSSVEDWFKAMGEHPTNKRFGEDWARLTKDLLFDSEGSFKFKPELWNDILKVIHQQNLKNLLGLSALLGTFSIVGKMKRGNKYYKFDKLTIYSGIYYIKYFKNSRLWWSM